MTKWEYQMVEYNVEAMTYLELNKNLNDEGNEGWEAVCVLHPMGKTARILMKRQKVQKGSVQGHQVKM